MSEQGIGQVLSESVDKSASVPRYHQVKRLIKLQIKEGNMPLGARIESVAEMARSLKVSKTTVAKATTELIDEGVLYSEVGRGTFVADLRDKRTHTICFVVYSGNYITLPYFSQIIAGISNVAEAEHYKLQFLTSARAVRTIGGRRPYPAVKETQWADGLIIMDHLLEDEQVRHLAEQLPVVLIDRKIPASNIACVRADDRGGTHEAISYLAGLGHRRIGMISGPLKWQADQERLAGYKAAVRELDLDDEPALVIERGQTSLHSALDALLSLADRPTAIFVCDDPGAFEVVQTLRERNLRVPQDVAVVSFDGALGSVLDGQRLTTMRLPITRMGRVAAEMLLAMIQKEEFVNKEAVFTPKLAVRQTCGGAGNKKEVAN
ncbi:MAG: GntR family transcriptional regulator [Planctomycetota bacterium]|nr:GntR family transcriptional regulator [Planctomycetota bacterium]